MLKISKTKIAHVIMRAKDYDRKSGRWDDRVLNGFLEEGGHEFMEGAGAGAAREDLAEFVSELSEAEKASLVALAEVGRGAVEPEQFEAAVAAAKAEHMDRTGDYLLATPMVADYLEEGLDKLGYSAERIRSEAARDG